MSPHTAQIKTSKMVRISWLIAGCISTGIGFVGIIIPGLPTTVFMLIAAACFYRSSQRFYNWVISHKLFGNHVKNYREGKGMPKRAKVMAFLFMWGFVLFAVLLGIPDHLLWVKIITSLSAMTGTGYIANLPTLENRSVG
jgi:uncharacterized membrane protein YbaN (DUF454 family)